MLSISNDFHRRFLTMTQNCGRICFHAEERRHLHSNLNLQPIDVMKIENEFKAYGNGKVNFKTVDNVGIITLNHPERKNAISGKMMSEMYELLQSLKSRQDIKGLILTGQGDIFCAGGDLQTISVHLNHPQKGWEMTCLMHETLKIFHELPMLSVSLVNGRALGGGAELTLATDLRIFAENSGKLTFVQAKMGLIPGWGGATRLRNLVGNRAKALEILLSCQTITSTEAMNLGLCDKIISDGNNPEHKLEQSLNWLEFLIKHDPKVISAMKQAVTNDNDEELFENERKLFGPLWAGPANRKALKENLKH